MSEEVVESTESSESTDTAQDNGAAQEAEAVAALQEIIDEKDGVEKPAEPEKVEESAEVEKPSEKEQKQTKEPASAGTPSAVIPPTLAYRAAQVMDQAEFAELADDPKALEKTVAALERRMSKDSSPRSKPDAKADVEQVDEIPDLDENEVAEPIAKAHKAAKGQISALKKQLEEVKSYLVERDRRDQEMYEQQRIEAEGSKFDSELNKLGLADRFGDGTIYDLQEGSEQRNNRLKLFEARQEIKQFMAQRKEKLPSEAELTKRALRLAFPDVVEQTNKKELAKKLEQGKRRLSNEPTNRKASQDATADEKTLEEFNKILAGKN
jgi:hypothetical protein